MTKWTLKIDVMMYSLHRNFISKRYFMATKLFSVNSNGIQWVHLNSLWRYIWDVIKVSRLCCNYTIQWKCMLVGTQYTESVCQ